MRKRFWSILLVFCMVLTLVPVFTTQAEAATYYANGKVFPNSQFAADGSNPYCNDGIAVGSGTHYCCFAYAMAAYNYIWDTTFSKYADAGRNNDMLRNLSASERTTTVEHVKAFFNNAVAGANVRFTSSSSEANNPYYTSDEAGHSLIFLGVNSANTGAYMLEGNYDNQGRSRIELHTWESMVRRGYMKYIIWPGAGAYNPGSDPIITFDLIDSPAPGKMHIRGWAFDSDNLNGTVPLHVYSGDTFLGEVQANTPRADVDNVYHCGVNHGFDAVLTTGLSGTINVRIAALNAFGGGNVAWTGEKPVTIAADTENPVISNVQISDRSSTGFTLTCTITDNVGIKEVKFPTWTEPDGQDDLVWHTGTVRGNTATCRINVSDHKNNVNCVYITDIYASDYADNTVMFRTSFGVDANPPIISNVIVENVSDEGYDIRCTVSDDDQAGVAKVLFPTWTAKDNQDDLIQPWRESSLYVGTIDGDKVYYHVNTSDHNSENGYYHTHIYAYDASGNSDWFAVDAYIGEISERADHIYQTGTFNGNQYIVFSNESYWSAASTFCQSLGGHLVSINSKEENDFVLSLFDPQVFAYWIGANDIETEGVFVWDSGEPFSYSNWRAGEPNNNGNQDCGLIMNNGTWDDDKVNATYPFIMEIEKNHSELAITAQPTDYTGKLNSTATFSVSAEGDGLSYQWEVSTNGGRTWSKSSVTQAKYAAKLTAEKDGRMVKCIVTDQYGNRVTSNAATMHVAKLVITTQPVDYSGALNSTARFNVAAAGTGNLHYQWQVSTNYGKSWSKSSVTQAVYAAKLTSEKDNRMVRCIVTDDYGNSITSDPAAMHIVKALEITRQPVDYNGALDSQARFTVAAIGEGLTYQWQVSTNGGRTWSQSSVKSAVYSAKLTAEKNNRMVRCVVTDKNGNSVTSEPATMKITTLSIVTQPVNYTGAENSTARFTVVATGEGLSYQWQVSTNGGKTWSQSSVKSAVYAAKLTAEKDGRMVRCVITDASNHSVTSDPATMRIG